MTLKTIRFARKRFYVDAIRVTEENIQEVSRWCGGEIVNAKEKVGGHEGFLEDTPYIKVPVTKSAKDDERKTRDEAYIGDWVFHGMSGFKVFTHKYLKKNFEEAPPEPACGKPYYTADKRPCVLGRGHLADPNPVSCRSLQDYKIATPSPVRVQESKPGWEKQISKAPPHSPFNPKL